MFVNMVRLAAPIVFLQCALFSFGVVDILFISRVGNLELSGMGLAHAIFFGVFVFGMGLVAAVDSVASQARGAGDARKAASAGFQAVLLAIAAGFPLVLILDQAPLLFSSLGVEAAVAHEAEKFLSLGKWTVIPGLVFCANRFYLQSLEKLRTLVIVILVANLLNAFLNWCFVWGAWGAPALGIRGSALATFISNIALASGSWVAARKEFGGNWRFNRPVFLELFRLGLPVGLHYLVEVSVFSLVTALISRSDTTQAAAHQITLNICSASFMVPIGVSFAGAVKVGEAVGQKNHRAAEAASLAALALGVGFMCSTALLFWFAPGVPLGIYTNDAEVAVLAAALLSVGAVFQVFDGTQVVLGGLLRGLGDTRSPFFANIFGHWCVGFPIGFWLAESHGKGALGFWQGLCVGLMVTSTLLLWRWRRAILRIRKTGQGASENHSRG